MNTRPQRSARRRATVPAGHVLDLQAERILRALAQRQRYKYVQPRVERLGAGWKIASPNCSRHIDPAGGEIDIAWLVPGERGTWALHARDHAQGGWVLAAAGMGLADALAQLCADPARSFWP